MSLPRMELAMHQKGGRLTKRIGSPYEIGRQAHHQPQHNFGITAPSSLRAQKQMRIFLPATPIMSGMKPVHVFNVIPSLPAALEGLRRLAHNLRWAWDHGTIELFRRLDSDLWESTGHNPVLILGLIDQAQLEAAARDESFLAQLDLTARDLDAYLAGES